MDAFTLKVYIYMYLTNLRLQQNSTLSDFSWKFSDNVLGSLDVFNIQITGFESLTTSINHITVTEDESGNNNVCVQLPLGYQEWTLEYDADIGIDNEIPIYGEGHFLYRMEDLEFNICLFVNHDEQYIDDVSVVGTYRHTPLEFTGFWRNEQVSITLQRILNHANRIIAMWNAYEPEQASCLWNPFVSYALNVWLENENATFEFDLACLKGILFDEENNDETDDSDQIEEKMFRKIVKSEANSDDNGELNILTEDDKSVILPLFKQLTKIIMRLQ